MGSSKANVKQTQYRRVEGNNKCVVHTTGEIVGGLPFSDCFTVEARWVVTRLARNEISLQVGIFVDFVKSTVMARKIRDSVIRKVTKAQLGLLEKAQQACGACVDEESVQSTPNPQTGMAPSRRPPIFHRFAFWLRSSFRVLKRNGDSCRPG